MSKYTFLTLHRSTDKDGQETISPSYSKPKKSNITYEEMRSLMSLDAQIKSGHTPNEVSCKVSPVTGDSAEDFSDGVFNSIDSLKTAEESAKTTETNEE